MDIRDKHASRPNAPRTSRSSFCGVLSVVFGVVELFAAPPIVDLAAIVSACLGMRGSPKSSWIGLFLAVSGMAMWFLTLERCDDNLSGGLLNLFHLKRWS